MRKRIGITMALALLSPMSPARADDPSPSGPPPVPATRDDMKRALEDSKHAEPRLPLPPVTDAERAAASKSEWGLVNNGRMRKFYLAPEWSGGWFSREPEPGMTLGYPFQTMLFWIVSRGNNCNYCMGHQESKLASAGLPEERIAALDGDWSEFDDAERAAFAFARKLTLEPDRIGDEDINQLRKHYDNKQILEIIYAVGNFNAMNRWTGALRIPQESHRVYLTPTPAKYRGVESRVAPLDPGRAGSSIACAAPSRRPPLESRAEVEAALSACRERAARLPLVDEAKARSLMPAGWPEGPLPRWVRLLANFPKSGPARAAGIRAFDEQSKLGPLLRAQVAWVAARQDRAWYALGLARDRLRALGQSDDANFALDRPESPDDPTTRAALAFARKLTADPALIGDADVAGLRELYPDKEVAELVHHVTNAAFLDRLTEAAGLPLEK